MATSDEKNQVGSSRIIHTKSDLLCGPTWKTRELHRNKCLKRKLAATPRKLNKYLYLLKAYENKRSFTQRRRSNQSTDRMDWRGNSIRSSNIRQQKKSWRWGRGRIRGRGEKDEGRWGIGRPAAEDWQRGDKEKILNFEFFVVELQRKM